MTKKTSLRIEQTYRLARQRFADAGVDVESALARLEGIALSLPCWQGDDVRGFERLDAELDGGLAATGNYPGRARSPDELRRDLDQACALIPGRHRVSLHASYAETGRRRVARNELQAAHFENWIAWSKSRGRGLDFNPTFFAHPLAAGGLTLTHPDRATRRFWIEHGIASRRIAAAIGRRLGTPCVNNIWIPDGSKDTPADRRAPRERLTAALDAIFKQPLNRRQALDAVESKLFGIGSESYVAGSHDFYLAYAVARQKLLCLDTGHFHPTESVADKLSAILPWVPGILLHLSRGVRWDSDHVATYTDDLRAIADELVRGDWFGKVHIGLDYFDASINRIAAWAIGGRAVLKALLAALLTPSGALKKLETAGDFTGRLAMMEDAKALPFGAVWDYHCLRHSVPLDFQWMDEVRAYERNVLSQRTS